MTRTKNSYRFSLQAYLLLGFHVILIAMEVSGLSTSAQVAGTDKIPEQREIHNTFSDEKEKGTILEATNPMELIRRLREAKSMDNATNPSDAIDDALKAFERQDNADSSVESNIR